MKKINFKDGQEPAIDEENLNQMQDNIEEAVNEASQTGGILTGTIVDYDGETVPEGYEEVEDDEADGILTGSVIGFKGDTIPEGYEEVDAKNIITCGINEDYTLSSEQVVGSPEVSAVLINKIGTQLSVVDGRIKIGKGIKKIKFYGNMAVKTTTAGKKACLQVVLRYASGGDVWICSQSIYCPVVDFPFNTGVAPFLLDVNEGDMIFFRNYLEKGITVQKENTNITVEAVG